MVTNCFITVMRFENLGLVAKQIGPKEWELPDWFGELYAKNPILCYSRLSQLFSVNATAYFEAREGRMDAKTLKLLQQTGD